MPNRAATQPPERDASIAGQRDTLVAAAIALADREGLAAVSIRRIAAEVGMRPMSLYTYIASKQELLELMAEAVVGEVLVEQSLPDGWRAAVETIAMRSHRCFVAHPWLAAISQQRADLGTSALHHAEQLLAAISPLPLRPGEAWEILYLLNDYTLGHALRIAHAPPPEAGRYPPFDPERFPLLAATVHGARRRDDQSFLAGLRRILDGIEATHAGSAARRVTTKRPGGTMSRSG